MVTLVSRETIIYYLGAAPNKIKSFALAQRASFFVASCSSTVIPVSSGLYYAGAGIGASFIVLWKEEMKSSFSAIIPKGEKIVGKKEAILMLLLALTLLAPNYLVQEGPYIFRVYVFLAGIILTALYAIKFIEVEGTRRWMEETVWFVKMIFPLLLASVFIVGVIGKVLPKSWVEDYLGGSSLFSSWFAKLIGKIMYFATMT